MFNSWPYSYLPPLPTIHTASIESCGLNSGIVLGSGWISATWSAANRAFFVPFHLEVPIKPVRLFMCNGTVVSGNFDLGIYSADFRLLVSIGSTAQATVSIPQPVNIATPITIGPGDFYFAIVFDNTTATVLRGSPTTAGVRRCGVMQQDSGAFPLPTLATPISPTVTYLPLVGLRQGGSAL